MRGLLSVLLAVLGTASAQNSYVQRDFALFRGQWQPIFAWCDAPDRVIIVGQPPAPPRSPQPVYYQRFFKKVPHDLVTKSYLLGPAEGAAGSTYLGLTADKQHAASSNFFVHLSNIEKAGQDDYLASRVVEIKSPLDPQAGQCRYDQNAVFVGAGARRTVRVLKRYSGDYAYESRDYSGGGVFIPGGEKHENASGSVWYEFHNGGYTYRVQVDPPGDPGAHVVVSRGGQPVLREALRVYSDSRPQE